MLLHRLMQHHISRDDMEVGDRKQDINVYKCKKNLPDVHFKLVTVMYEREMCTATQTLNKSIRTFNQV